MSIVLFTALTLASSQAAAPVCTTWGAFELLATCDDCPRINESSGVVPARHREGVWFTHNDAGGTAELYAFDTAGTHLETHPVRGGGFRDWEDIATGPCPAGVDAETCIFIGDVGDNGSSREEIDIWVVAEPIAGEPADVVANWRLRYPVEAHDCEAIVVHPCTGRVYLLTKEREGEPMVFRVPDAPTGPDSVAEVELVATMPRTWFGESGLITGADWSEGGDQLAMRTYEGGWFWQTDPGDPDAHWATPPTPLPIDIEGQGESIAFHPDGGVLTTTERTPMRIVHLPCETSTDPSECPPPEVEDTGSPADTAAAGDTGCCADTGPDEEPEPDGDGSGDTEEGRSEDTALRADPTAPGSSPSKDECGCSGGAGAWIVVWCLLGLHRRRSGAAD